MIGPFSLACTLPGRLLAYQGSLCSTFNLVGGLPFIDEQPLPDLWGLHGFDFEACLPIFQTDIPFGSMASSIRFEF